MTDARPFGEDRVRHYSSHAELLPPARAGRSPLDAIVVPAARPAENLESVLRLGAELGVPVVLLCSGHTRPTLAADLADTIPGARCAVVDLASPVDVGLPDFETSTFGEAMIGSHGDLSVKRNLGLLLGRMCGWETLLFVDDDIRDLDPALARRAAGALQHHTAVGMPATGFPDNSVVCHARRLAGHDQGVFVSGSALAVHLERADSFFPEVYNEDWLFLAPHLAERQVVAVGSVQQVPYRPFGTPRRSAAEEFGDVLAEGLIGSLHTGRWHRTLSADYWSAFLDRRAAFIAEAVDGCARNAAGHPDVRAATAALATAEQARARLVPEVLAEYVQSWRADLATWREYVAGIARRGDLSAALDRLGLSASTISPSPARRLGPS